MQKLTLKRKYREGEATLGIITMKSKELCRTLERPWLDNQSNVSCIPEGKYIAKKYSSAKYPDVWELKNVKDRTYILIHAGNLVKHTEGCILVGMDWGFLNDELAVLSSRKALYSLRMTLGDEFEIEIS